MALSADRQVKRREGTNFNDPVAASTKIYLGALVVLNAAGNAAPGTAATGLKVRGIAAEQVDNSAGAIGDKRVETRTGIFPFKNSASADLIARADIGTDCYIVDDETVAKTSGSSTRSVAGKVVDIDAAGVWVKIGV